MNLTKYKFKITSFIIFIIFCMIFFTGIGFFSYREYNSIKSINNHLNIAKMKISNLEDFQKIVSFLDNLDVSNIVSNIMLDKKIKINEIIKKKIGVGFVNIYSPNEEIVFQNFDINNCNNKFICKRLIKDKFNIVIAEKHNAYLISTYNILIFSIFSFFISILFSPLIYYIIYRITKPIEQNFEFMKNFVNNAGHELKTPIANINLSSQILQQKGKYDKAIVNDLIKESSNISQLIDTLLQISILSKFDNKEKVELKQEIQHILMEYNIQNYNLVCDLDNVVLDTNKKHFYILFTNLLKNAYKYNDKNKYIGIFLKKNQLIIENSGNNISKQDLNKIFSLFYRIDNQKEGYGLGLAIVKKIVDINKRDIKTKSRDGLNKFILTF